MQAVVTLILSLFFFSPFADAENNSPHHKTPHDAYTTAWELAQKGEDTASHIWVRKALRFDPALIAAYQLRSALEQREPRLAQFGSAAYPWEVLGDSYLIEILMLLTLFTAFWARKRSLRTRLLLVALMVLFLGMRWTSRHHPPAWAMDVATLSMGPGKSYLQRGAVQIGDEVRILEARRTEEGVWVKVRAPNLSEGWVAKSILLD